MNGKFVKYYDYKNSPIERFDGKNANYQIVSGIKFDTNSNLWLLNSQAPTASLIRLKDGQFTKFNHQEWMKLNDGGYYNKSNGNLSQILIDSRDLMWFVNDHFMKPAYYRYDIDIDKAAAYENFVNQDGTTIQNLYGVKCVTEDLENNLWIGTDQGPFMIEKASILSGEAPLIQVKVPRNDGTNFADYLLSGINITNIAIDGGGRKWFATNGNGVYLISADNMTQLQHFTTDNSKLLSNSVMSIAINQTTGEVFFGTDKGLCSYISDATETNTEMTSDNVWAYPNPVEPSYTGPITIPGLTLNADIKILSANGAVVNEGRSNGGTYIWDGCDKKGRRVASGVYMVATATNKGEKGTVCKIAIVR
jgi:ligand-binding sensor domain-containing protein